MSIVARYIVAGSGRRSPPPAKNGGLGGSKLPPAKNGESGIHSNDKPQKTKVQTQICLKSIVFVGPGFKNEALTLKIEVSGPKNQLILTGMFTDAMEWPAISL